jgi:hypothetical protein
MENINRLNNHIGKAESQRLKNIDDVEDGILDVKELDELIVGPAFPNKFNTLRRDGLSIYKKIN